MSTATRLPVAQEVKYSSANEKVSGLIPDFPSLHVEVSLGKTPNPTFPLLNSPGV